MPVQGTEIVQRGGEGSAKATKLPFPSTRCPQSIPYSLFLGSYKHPPSPDLKFPTWPKSLKQQGEMREGGTYLNMLSVPKSKLLYVLSHQKGVVVGFFYICSNRGQLLVSRDSDLCWKDVISLENCSHHGPSNLRGKRQQIEERKNK